MATQMHRVMVPNSPEAAAILAKIEQMKATLKQPVTK